MTQSDFDVLVIGSGPAGQKAAIQSAKAGRRAALIESDRYLGGACVHRGTIPSKTLRESALRIRQVRRQQELLRYTLEPGLEMAALVSNLHSVLQAHHDYIDNQLRRNGVVCFHGRASFRASDTVEVETLRGEKTRFACDARDHRDRFIPQTSSRACRLITNTSSIATRFCRWSTCRNP